MVAIPKFRRYLKIQVLTSDPPGFLSKIMGKGINIQSVEFADTLKFTGVIPYKDYQKMRSLQYNHSVEIEILHRYGLFWMIQSLRLRPVLLAGMLVFLLLSFILPGRILFVRTEGNVAILDALLIEQVANCGIKFGSKSRDIRSEQIKNRLLSENEVLQWVGVDFDGCVATIHVREKSRVQSSETNHEISSVVAGYSGIVSEITVLNGTPLCQVGQQVGEGDILISGYTDCGLKIQAGAASGEVFAYTLRPLTAVLPAPVAQKRDINSKHRCVQLRIGKKLINFCNHSGILYATCDKMYVEKYCALPGGFRLPVSIIVVSSVDYATERAELDRHYALQWLEDFSAEYLRSRMVAGRILDEDCLLTSVNGAFRLSGTYACEEMIGQVRFEGTRMQYAEDN